MKSPLGHTILILVFALADMLFFSLFFWGHKNEEVDKKYA
jgi:hypothetical protein